MGRGSKNRRAVPDVSPDRPRPINADTADHSRRVMSECVICEKQTEWKCVIGRLFQCCACQRLKRF